MNTWLHDSYFAKIITVMDNIPFIKRHFKIQIQNAGQEGIEDGILF